MQDGKHVILYVDDDQDFLDNVRMILEANDYVMVEASSAEDGLRVFKDAKPDFIIVDLMMEEVDAGINLVKEMKLAGNTVPVYMLSSVGDSLNMNIDYTELGLSGVFQKPIKPQILLSTLKKKLGEG